MSELIAYPVVITGGLNDSVAQPSPGDLQKLSNFGVFRGRFALRAPLLHTANLGSTVTNILAIGYHDLKMYIVAWNSSTQVVSLWQASTDGSSATNKQNIWTGATTAPRPVLASIEGGSAVAGVSRLYICDYDGQQVTRVYDSDGDTIANLQTDLDDDSGLEDVTFTYMREFQYHMWGAGYLEAAVSRPEMIRFSQPGLIPAVEPSVNNPYSAEWWVVDRRSIGARGEKVTCMSGALGSMIVFKKNKTHALFGYDRESWANRVLSESLGAVGPYAADSTGDGLCFFWSERGPCVTNGEKVFDELSESVRRHVLEANVNDDAIVLNSADDGLVYFLYPVSSSSYPDHWIAFDRLRKAWSEGEWSAYDGGTLLVAHGAFVASVALPAPIAGPSSLTATSGGATTVDLAWTNGDTALDNETQIWGRTSPASGDTLLATVASGVASWEDTGRSSITQYYYTVRHIRNTNTTSFSGEANATTDLAPVTAITATRSATGILISMTNNENGADLLIYRKKTVETGWTLLTTLSAEASGTSTHDDTTGDDGVSYDYRVLVQKAGETDSAYSDTVTNSAGGSGAGGGVPQITSLSHTVYLSTCSGTFITVTWAGTDFVSGDRVKISRSIDGDAYVVKEASYDLLAGSYRDTWYALDNGGSATLTVRYKLEVLDDGVTVDTDFTAQSTENATVCAE